MLASTTVQYSTVLARCLMTPPHGQTWQAPQARAPLPRALAAGRHAAAQQGAPRHPGHLLQVGSRDHTF